MAIAARFFIDEITEHSRFVGIRVKLAPVTASGARGEHNREWSKFTPSGEIVLSVTNPAAMEWFKARLGRDLSISIDDRPIEELEPLG